MDFVHDVLADDTKIRLLTILDIFSRESVALEVDYEFKAPQLSTYSAAAALTAESPKERGVITRLVGQLTGSQDSDDSAVDDNLAASA